MPGALDDGMARERTDGRRTVGGHAPDGRRPLRAWRSLDPHDIDAELVGAVRRALSGPVLVHDRRWPSVLGGDAATAVGVAIRFLRSHRPDRTTGDLVMSAVLVHAASGDPAAALLLAHGLAVLARGRPDADVLGSRARLWAAVPFRTPSR